MKKYDYIIAGAGAVGLMLAYRMTMDSFFNKKKILLLDKSTKSLNDKTWCYWEAFDQERDKSWDPVVFKTWNSIFFGSPYFSKRLNIKPYQYKLIKSIDFYNYIRNRIEKAENFDFESETVQSINDKGEHVELNTDFNEYQASKVFCSIMLSDQYKKQRKFPVLNQHFVGWFIESKTAVFDDSYVTFMDFNLLQRGNTRFMYVIPLSRHKALVEYTLFSEGLLEKNEYEQAIKAYLKEKNISNYIITAKESGVIPMTSYQFRQQNTKNVLYLGTAGGWTKPSTGYTFHTASKKTKKLITFLKTKVNLQQFDKRTKFWYYDLIFLDRLYQENELGAYLFSRLFKKIPVTLLLKFLDEETSFVEDLRILSTMPKIKFTKAVIYRILKELRIS